MVLRKLRWILAAKLICSLVVIEAQNERSYNTNDWIPMTPSSSNEEPTKRATGRVLNLDAPSQKFFPGTDYDHRKRRPQVDQPLRENNYNTVNTKAQQTVKNENEYKFEVPSLPPKFQYYPDQEVKQPTYYEQPPPLPLNQAPQVKLPESLTQQQAPAVNALNLYEQYNIPFNNSFYQSINPTAINQDLLVGTPDGQNVPLASATPTTAPKVQDEKESVQLLYVPVENLQANLIPQQSQAQPIFQQINQAGPIKQIYTNNAPQRLSDVQQDIFQQSLQAQRLQQQFYLGKPLAVQASTTTTAKPKKRKPHQPPLSVFLDSNFGTSESAVLEILKAAKTVAVQDKIVPNSPQIFIGPSALDSPQGYSKFPLPYLNKVDGNRIEKKIDNLPFFVAPLSYKAPSGFSKIPLPSPHVGSIVVSNKEDPNKRAAVNSNKVNSIHGTDTQAYFGPSQQSTQPPNYLQFNVNDNLNTFISPQKPTQLIQPNQQPLTSDQFKIPETTAQKQNANLYSTGLEAGKDYKLPARQQYTGFDNTGLGIGTYDFAPYDPRGLSDEKYGSSSRTSPRQHLPPNDNKSSNNAKQRGRQSTTVTPSRYNDAPSALTSAPEYQTQAPLISITPKSTTSAPIKSKGGLGDYHSDSHRVSETKEKDKNTDPLDLTINQYELHQINDELLYDKAEKTTKDPFEYKYPYEDLYITKPKEYDFSSKFEDKMKDFDFSSHFDNPKYDYGSQYDHYTSTPSTILRDSPTKESTSTGPESSEKTKGRRREKGRTTTEAAGKETYTVLEDFSAEKTTESPHRYLPDYKSRETTEPQSSKNQDTANEFDPFLVPNFEEESQVGPTQQFEDNPQITPLVENRGQKPAQVETTSDVTDFVSDLQDQSVRTLLIPNLLVPSDHRTHIVAGQSRVVAPISRSTTTEKPTEATTRARLRIRQRGGNKFTTLPTQSATTPPRRNIVARRRPVHPSRTTEKPAIATESSVRDDVQRASPRPKIRSRGRNFLSTITEKPTTSTENEVRVLSEPTSRATSDAQITPREPQLSPREPQLFIQFDSGDDESGINVGDEPEANNEFLQIYGLPPDMSILENPKGLLQYDNTAPTQAPVVVQPTHPVAESQRHPSISRTTESQAQVQSGGVLHNRNDVSSKPTGRVRGRLRSRTRVTTSSTGKPSTRRATNTPYTTTTKKKAGSTEETDEFFGFIRQPNFNQINNIQIAATTKQPVYQSAPTAHSSSVDHLVGKQSRQHQTYENPSEVSGVSVDINGQSVDTTTVKFIGQIRPRYRSNNQNTEQLPTTEQVIQQETETPKPKIKPRTRAPQRRTSINSRQSTRETTTVSPGSTVTRGRGRGSTHYKPPTRQRDDIEADVEGDNYPPQFLKSRQVAAASSNSFQISIDPSLEEEEEDQVPYSSIAQPNILPTPDGWTEATENVDNFKGYVPVNQITGDEKKPKKEKAQAQAWTTTEQLSAETAESTTVGSDEAYKEDAKEAENLFKEINEHKTVTTTTENARRRKGNKRGVWKLVRQAPVDPLEIAESQNYYSVINTFHEIPKTNKKFNDISNSKKDFSQQRQTYNNFNPVLEQNPDSFDYEIQKVRPAEKTVYQYEPSQAKENQTILNSSTNSQNKSEHKELPTTTTTTITKENFFDSLYEMFGISKKDGNTEELSTTVKTIIDHESFPQTTTTVSPTFPQEITEIPETTVLPEDDINTTTDNEPSEDTQTITTTSPKVQVTRTYEVEPWEMKAVRTSTSTEISHETEICYRGRCVKSAENKGGS